MADTTLLDGDARQLYAGSKLGKYGVEILLEDKAAPGVNCCVCFLLAGHYVQISGYRNWKLNGAE